MPLCPWYRIHVRLQPWTWGLSLTAWPLLCLPPHSYQPRLVQVGVKLPVEPITLPVTWETGWCQLTLHFPHISPLPRTKSIRLCQHTEPHHSLIQHLGLEWCTGLYHRHILPADPMLGLACGLVPCHSYSSWGQNVECYCCMIFYFSSK